MIDLHVIFCFQLDIVGLVIDQQLREEDKNYTIYCFAFQCVLFKSLFIDI